MRMEKSSRAWWVLGGRGRHGGNTEEGLGRRKCRRLGEEVARERIEVEVEVEVGGGRRRGRGEVERGGG